MAPTFRHGKTTTILVDQYSFSEYLNDFTLGASCDVADVTTFRQNDHNFIPGLRDVTVSLTGLFTSTAGASGTTNENSIAEFFDNALGGSTRLVVSILPDSTAVGARALLMTGDATAWDVMSPVSDVVSCSAELQGSDGYRGGRILQYNFLSTSTGSQAAVNSGLTNGGTTGGGVAHLHVISVNSSDGGTTGTATFKVQHSTSGSTWADLITFTAATAATFQRSTVAGTIKEQVRASLSALGTTEDTARATIAFARHSGPRL